MKKYFVPHLVQAMFAAIMLLLFTGVNVWASSEPLTLEEQAQLITKQINDSNQQKVTRSRSGARSGVRLTRMPTSIGSPNYTGQFTRFDEKATLTFWRENVDGTQHLFVQVQPITTPFFFCPGGHQFSVIQNSRDFGNALRVTRGDDGSVCQKLMITEIFLVDQWSTYTGFLEAQAFTIYYSDSASYYSGRIDVASSGGITPPVTNTGTYDDGKKAGIQQCVTNPASCGITTTTADTNGSTQQGIDQCKTNPTSCGITIVDTNGSTQTGIDQCKANPVSCGITTGTPAAITKLDGISTNAFITPANKMIAGVLISGGTKRVMVRASSVDGAVDPQLEIVTYPDRRPLGSNDSWATDPGAAELTQKKLAPGRATDAAMIINLPPGLFTMEITSKNGGSGAGVIEVYDMAVFP